MPDLRRLINCLMTAKKTAANKRTDLPRTFEYTQAFVKDWTRLSHSGRYDMVRLKEVMLLPITNDVPLGAEWEDHSLMGNWLGYRECHVGGDFLLIYQIENDIISFIRAGTHSDLF